MTQPIPPSTILAQLFDRYAAALVLYARQWTPGPEDVVQDAFLALARQPSLPDDPPAWLFRTVRNAGVSTLRSTLRRRRREAVASAPESWFARVDDQLDARTAAEALEALDPDLREVLVARIWGSLTFEQIARLQGCGLATAHRRYREGLSLLNQRLTHPCEATS